MCGIAGYIGTNVISQNKINNCLDKMKRRGPDSQNFYNFEHESGKKIYLLHSRLSIIDLEERSNQPFIKNPHVLVFNGEIYNYIEVRNTLKIEKTEFTTSSDTEVLLEAIIKYDYNALNKLEGMWSFAYYNELSNKFFLSRDRFGEKPLYFYRDNEGFYFASEVKFISALAGKKFKVNYNQISRYLINGYKSLYKKPETFFEEIYEVKPGTVLEIAIDNTIKSFSYWNPQFEQNNKMSLQEAIEGTNEALINSMKLRLRADVPLAFCMSGGIDSNSLISIAKKILNYDVCGFTILNSDERYDEKELVEYSVKELGIKHIGIPVNTSNFLSNLKNLIKYHDAPIYTISYYAHWLLMESVKNYGFKISISGTAADELFTGYYDHYIMHLYELNQKDQNLFDINLANWKKHIKPVVRNPILSNPFTFLENPMQRDHIYFNSKEFSTYLKEDFFEAFEEVTYNNTLLRNRMLNEMFHEVIPVILHEDDLNAMFFSIESRILTKSFFIFCHILKVSFTKSASFFSEYSASITNKRISFLASSL